LMLPTVAQPGILAPTPRVGRYLSFALVQGRDVGAALQRLVPLVDGSRVVLGLGPDAVQAVGATVPGLRAFPQWSLAPVKLPTTPVALWCWLRGDDAGDLVLASRALVQAAEPAFALSQVVEGFRHGQGPNGHGRDLTGYEDGTENPCDGAAEAAALVGGGAGLAGGSFAALQQWQHDWDAFEGMAPSAQDAMIGRRRSDNEELDDAPESAHVKRTAQESFTPEAFVVRRSMPWAEGLRSGLMFVAFGRSFDAFEAQLRRMAGLEDGVVDALFQMSRPVTGAYVWCPPLRDGRLDLRGVGL
jgi:putative iron-dependent peroxidase